MKQHRKRFRFFSVCIFGSALFLCIMGVTLAEMPYGTLKANTAVGNLVSFELVQKIALKKAHERWGQVSPGPALAACDDDGDLVAYYFSFSIGTPPFPPYSAITATVQKGRKIAQEGLKAMTEAEKQKLLDDMKTKAEASAAEPGNSANPPGGKTGAKPVQVTGLTDADAKKLGREMMIGAEQYGTIVVSARYDRFPVPLYMHYLHPYFYQGDLAEKEAVGALKKGTATFERIYFLGRGHGQFFEFSTEGQSVLMNIYDLEVVSPEKVLKRKGNKVIPEPGAMAQIDEEWAKIKKEVE